MNFQQSPNPRQRANTAPKTPTPDMFNEYKPRLSEEISVLMKANGDSVNTQSRDSINLVEKILVQQLRGIMSEVMNVAYKRTNSVIPSQCDFEFLMRRNSTKIQRFRKYMKTVYYLKAAESKQGGHTNMNFLNKLAEDNASDDEEETYDPIKMRRLFRADRISQILNQQKYEEFLRARSWSSNIRNKTDMLRKLMEILQIPKDIQDNSNCQEIILFLAIETVATIVDFAILTRLNTSNHITESFTVSSSITNNMLHLCPEVTQGRASDGIKAITVQEINEAIRRVQEMSTKRMGTSFRSNDMRIPFLAL